MRFAKHLFFFFLLCTMPIFSNEINFPKCIDFGKFNSPGGQQQAWRLGFFAFNRAPELTPFFVLLKNKYNILTAIETGTYKGCSTVLFGQLFEQVHTIEISEKLYLESSALLSPYTNVHCHLGSSEKILKEILPNLVGQPVLFYLDAHWQSHWPLLEELDEISQTHKDNCIIVIDDFKVPQRSDIDYDKYDTKECSHEYIKEKLNKIFTSYDFYFLIPKSVKSRAKFVAIPKQWATAAHTK